MDSLPIKLSGEPQLIRDQTMVEVMKRRLDHKDSGVYFPGSSAGKEFACDAGDPGSIPGL